MFVPLSILETVVSSCYDRDCSAVRFFQTMEDDDDEIHLLIRYYSSEEEAYLCELFDD